jgi:hypothetical protein
MVLVESIKQHIARRMAAATPPAGSDEREHKPKSQPVSEPPRRAGRPRKRALVSPKAAP